MKLLTDLTAVTEPSWATPLAFQELARLDSDEGKTAEAEKVLRQALKRYPNDLRLHVQLAAVLDRRPVISSGFEARSARPPSSSAS